MCVQAAAKLMEFAHVIVKRTTLLTLCTTGVLNNSAMRCVGIVGICESLAVVSTVQVISRLLKAVLLDLARLWLVTSHVQECVLWIGRSARASCDLCGKRTRVDSGC